jgi:hypothetical protein
VFSSCELLKVICSQKAGVKFPYQNKAFHGIQIYIAIFAHFYFHCTYKLLIGAFYTTLRLCLDQCGLQYYTTVLLCFAPVCISVKYLCAPMFCTSVHLSAVPLCVHTCAPLIHESRCARHL